MNRNLFILTIAGLLAGCAGSKPQRPDAIGPVYLDAPAASLAFTPPIALDQPPLELARDLRQPAAFVGFDELTTTSFHIRTDDRFGDDGFDWLTRRAVSDRVGISYR